MRSSPDHMKIMEIAIIASPPTMAKKAICDLLIRDFF